MRTIRLGPWQIQVRRAAKAPLRKALGQPPYRLHLGPGPGWGKPDASWLTVDIDPERADIVADFGSFKAFDLPDACCLSVYGSHVFEHISIWTSQQVFNEIARVLRPGGVFRAILPDVERSIRAYIEKDAAYELFRRRTQRARDKWGQQDYTLFDCLREDFLSRSGQPALLGQQALAHQNAWDFETLARDLSRAGFSRVERSGFRQSRTPDFAFEGTYPSEANEDYRSLYVEAFR